MAQLNSDADFLRAIGVMDYSLLLGVHFPGRRCVWGGEGGGRGGRVLAAGASWPTRCCWMGVHRFPAGGVWGRAEVREAEQR